MLNLYPPQGKRVLLTAAGSDCAILLGQWARSSRAAEVYGIHRSPVHGERLAAMGIIPIDQGNTAMVTAVAARADVVFDATGGSLAETLLSLMPEEGYLSVMGCSAGKRSGSNGPFHAWSGSTFAITWMR